MSADGGEELSLRAEGLRVMSLSPTAVSSLGGTGGEISKAEVVAKR